MIVALADGSLVLTTVYAALAVWVLGLAVPVTASYIIAAVMIAPALTSVGIAPAAAHMFIFYYAVLSEVSPPTALSPFAAAAITGGNPFRTTMISWKYVAPAFVVPVRVHAEPRRRRRAAAGQRRCMSSRPRWLRYWVSLRCRLAISGWLRRKASLVERGLLLSAAVLLFFPQPVAKLGGAAIGAVTIVRHWRSG